MKRTPYINIISMLIFLTLFVPGCTMTLCARPEYIVTRTDDPAGGVCAVEDCSLRQAVAASNMCSGFQIIRIPAGTYTLSIAGRGEDANAQGDLDVTDSTMIIGEGAPVIDGGGLDRVLQVHTGKTALIFGLIIQNGHSTSMISEDIEGTGDAAGSGGGIRNDGTTYIFYTIVRNNSTGPSGWGGGILNNGLLMRITHSLIEGNAASSGGGILNRGRYFSVTYSSIQGNYAGGLGYGGGLHNDYGGIAAFVSESTIINNDTNGVGSTGDGVSNAGRISLRNVTISGNEGDGVESSHGHAVISYSTIVNNGRFGFAGTTADSRISNSILEGNWQNCSGGSTMPSSNGYNISSDATCSFSSAGDLNSQSSLIGPLAFNGGLTMTHALNAGSPALDSAGPSECVAIDQRSVARPQGTVCDRGAYEMNVVSGADSSSPTPVAPGSSEVMLVVEKPANCRQGPGVVYPVVNSVVAGQQVQVIGKNADGTWWYSQLANDKCWISNVAGNPTGDLNLLAVIPAPPTPVPTATEAIPQEQPTEVPEIDFDQDGYGVSVDCDDKNAAINPGAVETPDDKVDSNCNGDDDK